MVTETQLIQKGSFVLGEDGRWRRSPDHQPCLCAEGLATECIGQSNCLICSNWNPRVGCALGHNHALDQETSRIPQMDVVKQQARAWVQIGMLQRAIYRLERVLRDHPDDARPHLELARLYDDPSYQGTDKRRAIALYQRFCELRAGQPNDPEVLEAQRRIPTLLRLPLPAPRRVEDEGGPVLATFACFYRFGSLTHLAYGILTLQRLILARVGDADPESGRSAIEVGEKAERSTRFLRWMAGTEAREREVRQTRHEIERVALLSPDVVARESRANVVLEHADVNGVGLEREDWRRTYRVTVSAGHLHHDLVFPDSRCHQAEHCEALMKHLAGRRRSPVAGSDNEITPRSALAGVGR